jgi:hypothetical protein
MSDRPEDMQITTMRVTKRTARHVEYLKGLLKLRTGRDYSPDDIVWEALKIVYRDDFEKVNETKDKGSE